MTDKQSSNTPRMEEMDILERRVGELISLAEQLSRENKALRTQQRVESTKHFARMLAPFTLVAYIGLVAIVLYAQSHSYFYALIAISILAFPHSVLMHFLYVKLRLKADA